MANQRQKMKKDIGIGVKAPKGKCEDKLCPWHGNLSIRGRVFEGSVKVAKSPKTAIVRWGFTRYVRKFERYERRSSRVTAHNPACIRAKEGDKVIIAECRPISKTKHFVVVAKVGEEIAGRLKHKTYELEEEKPKTKEPKAEPKAEAIPTATPVGE